MSVWQDTEQQLAVALDLWDQGEDWEAAMADLAPEQQAALRQAMQLAQGLREALPPPSAAAQARSRAAWLAAGAEPVVAGQARGSQGEAPRARLATLRGGAGTAGGGGWLAWRRPRLAWLAAGLAVWLALGGSAVWAAERSLPGDRLYPVKTWRYDLRVNLAASPEDRLRALRAQEDSYRRDCQAVLAEGREVAVEFFGRIERVEGGLWTIGGLPVDVSAADLSEILTSARPLEGRRVRVDGRTEGGRLVGLRLHPAELPQLGAEPGLPADSQDTAPATLPTATPLPPSAPDGTGSDEGEAAPPALDPNVAAPTDSQPLSGKGSGAAGRLVTPAETGGDDDSGDDKGGDDKGGDDKGGDDKGGDDKGGDDKGGDDKGGDDKGGDDKGGDDKGGDDKGGDDKGGDDKGGDDKGGDDKGGDDKGGDDKGGDDKGGDDKGGDDKGGDDKGRSGRR